jgi:hypothetical protein
MMAIIDAIGIRKLALLATALALTLSVIGCAPGALASHGADTENGVTMEGP